MKDQKLEVKVALQIGKPPNEVFEAIIDPAQMSRYFISESNGWMEEGKRLVWRFPEFDMDFPVRVGKVEKNKLVSYRWMIDDRETLVEIRLEPADDSTVVRITEGKMDYDEAGIKWLVGNTEGWANFLACLKAYLEYGINLRKGAFDFMKG